MKAVFKRETSAEYALAGDVLPRCLYPPRDGGILTQNIGDAAAFNDAAGDHDLYILSQESALRVVVGDVIKE